MITWVTARKLSELSGYSEEAIRQKKKKGIWAEGKHWRKAPDNRIVFNTKSIDEWLSGTRA
jgi:hypothetical protein